jgi:hypothetical protein
MKKRKKVETTNNHEDEEVATTNDHEDEEIDGVLDVCVGPNLESNAAGFPTTAVRPLTGPDCCCFHSGCKSDP